MRSWCALLGANALGAAETATVDGAPLAPRAGARGPAHLARSVASFSFFFLTAAAAPNSPQGELKTMVESLAEASSVWKSLGGFKRNRRNSKDLSDDVLLSSFKEIDKDGSGKIDRDELRDALEKENGKLD